MKFINEKEITSNDILLLHCYHYILLFISKAVNNYQKEILKKRIIIIKRKIYVFFLILFTTVENLFKTGLSICPCSNICKYTQIGKKFKHINEVDYALFAVKNLSIHRL